MKDLGSNLSSIESVSIVKNNPEVLPDELLGIPSNWEIDFDVDLLSFMNPTPIPPYRMAPAELTLQLKYLKDKCFIQPSIRNRELHCFLLKRRMDPLEKVSSA